MSYNIEQNKNSFLKLISKWEFYYRSSNTPERSPEKRTLDAVQKQPLLNCYKNITTNDVPCLKETRSRISLKKRKNFLTEVDKLNLVKGGYRKESYLQDEEVDLRLTKQQKLCKERLHPLSYFDKF